MDREIESFVSVGKSFKSYNRVGRPSWEQEVRDENGRRRFHGAFTGGFSAGYYNTVGSKEGWRPSSFRSSRSDGRSSESNRTASVENLIDEEDIMDGIGLHVSSTDLFSSSTFTEHLDLRTTPSPIGSRLIIEMEGSLGMNGRRRLGPQLPNPFELVQASQIPAEPKVGFSGLGVTRNGEEAEVREVNRNAGFGVGIYEAEDEDIYSKEYKPINYAESTQTETEKDRVSTERASLYNFLLYQEKATQIRYDPPSIPEGYEILGPKTQDDITQRSQQIRKPISHEERERMLGERSSSVKKWDIAANALKFTRGGLMKSQSTRGKGEVSRDNLQSVTVWRDVQRDVMEWAPHKILCKRMKLRNPYPETKFLEQEKDLRERNRFSRDRTEKRGDTRSSRGHETEQRRKSVSPKLDQDFDAPLEETAFSDVHKEGLDIYKDLFE